MAKKQTSIFNLNEEYQPRSVWNADFGELGEIQEKPLYTSEMPEDKYCSQNKPISLEPGDRFKALSESPLKSYSTQSDSGYGKSAITPNRNTLKINHQRITQRPTGNQGYISESKDRFKDLSAIPLNRYTSEGFTNIPRIAENKVGVKGNKTSGNDPVFSGKGPLDSKFLEEENIYIPTTGKNYMEDPVDFLNRSAMPSIKCWGQDLSGSDILSPYFPNRSGMERQEINSFLRNITPEQLDSINAVYRQYAEDARLTLQNMYGNVVDPIKNIQFTPDAWGQSNIEYKDGVITTKKGVLGRNEFEKRSDILHETQHHVDKDKFHFRKEIGKDGNMYLYEEVTNIPDTAYFIGDNKEEKSYTPQEWKNLKLKYAQPYIYKPSNIYKAEINALQTQIEAAKSGEIPLSQPELYRLQENIKSYIDYLKMAQYYEKKNDIGSNGYQKE